MTPSESEDESDCINVDARKRKKSGENHTHCHCKLFSVSDGLSDYMAGGQPYRRFKADQIKKRVLSRRRNDFEKIRKKRG